MQNNVKLLDMMLKIKITSRSYISLILNGKDTHQKQQRLFALMDCGIL